MVSGHNFIRKWRCFSRRTRCLVIYITLPIVMFSFMWTLKLSSHYASDRKLKMSTYKGLRWKQVTSDKGPQRYWQTAGFLDQEVSRKLLTKARYPMTIKAPFVISNSDICRGNVTLLIVVHTSTDHFSRRELMRQSIGNANLFRAKYSVRIAFLLGMAETESVADMIRAENEKYHDVVMAEFLDTYRNLTLKGVMGFRWISQYCPQAKLVVKMDDDIYVNIFKIIEHYVPKFKQREKQILCNAMVNSPIIRSDSKWNVDYDLFRSRDFFPPYCSGFAVLMTTGAVMAMYHAAQFTPFFWVDDVYLFGLLPSKNNVAREDFGTNTTLSSTVCLLSYSSPDPDMVACDATYPLAYKYYWQRSLATLSTDMALEVNWTAATRLLTGTEMDSNLKMDNF